MSFCVFLVPTIFYDNVCVFIYSYLDQPVGRTRTGKLMTQYLTPKLVRVLIKQLKHMT